MSRVFTQSALIISACFNMGSFANGADTNYEWRSIPLTTPAQSISGIAGGEGFQQVMSIVYAHSNPNVVYMSSDTTQVWKSTDAGHSWRAANNGISSNGVCSLFVHPENANIVIAAGCLGPEVERAKSLGDQRKEGIFRSTDGGKSWNYIHNTEFYKRQSTGSLFALDIRTIGKQELVLFAGSHNDGLLVSRDTGATWDKTNFDEGTITDIEASFAQPGLLLISTSRGLYQYRDGVINTIGSGLSEVTSNIAVSAAAPGRIVAAAGGRIYLSNDSGVTFQKSSGGLPPLSISKIVDVFASPVDSERLYAGTWKSNVKGPYYSEDGGKNWKLAETLNANSLTDGGGFWFPSPIAPHPREPLFSLAASNGKTRILRTENGGKAWQYSGSGYTGGRVVDMAFISPLEWYLALTDHGLWKTENGGVTFTNIEIPGIHPRSIGAVAVTQHNIVLSIGGWQDKSIAISQDAGESWRIFETPATDKLSFIRFHPQKKNVIYASNYRSDDLGLTWKANDHKVRALLYNNGDVVYGFDQSTSNVVESSDMGATWTILADCGDGDITVNEMTSDSQTKGRLYLATNNGPYRILSGKCIAAGTQSGFIRDSHGLLTVRSIAVDPTHSNVIYAGRWAPGRGISSGVFRSDDFGQTWNSFNGNIEGNFNVWSVDIEPGKATVFIGATHGLKVLDQKLSSPPSPPIITPINSTPTH